MEQLMEILKQIQDLAGVALDAVAQAAGGEAAPAPEGGGEGAPPEGPPEG